MSNQNNVIILRINRETNEVEEISLERAVNKLEGYWNDDYIKPALLRGEVLWNPYAEYKLKQS